MKNLSKAILAVMKDVKGIDKSMTVGSGNFKYQGVPDQQVKKIIGESMQRNGLCLLPIDIEATTEMDVWEESYNGKNTRKRQVFTTVKAKYLLMHESGESQEICGYGHGVDSQDKAAGKATTYALKYALLYSFIVPTGKIDDSDNTHSEEIAKPQPAKAKEETDNRSWLSEKQLSVIISRIEKGEVKLKQDTQTHFKMRPEQLKKLQES